MQPNQSPNFLFIFPDQWRWDWLGCTTSPFGKVPVKTPNIDRLSESGVRFNGCRTNSPVCSPARACLTLGSRYHRCEVPSNFFCTPPNRQNVFKLLRDAGYHTATCGKSDLFKPLHDETESGFLPVMEELGFSDGIDHRGKGDAINRARKGIKEPYTSMLKANGFLDTHLEDHPESPLQRAAYPTPLPHEYYTDDFCGQNALKLLRRTPQNKPWCLWVNFPGPHDPYDPPAELLERYEGVQFPDAVAPTDNPPAHRNVVKDRLHYAACCTNIDDWVGRLIAEVESRGEAGNTVVIFASDHGEMLGDHGRWTKQIYYEGSIRVPLIFAGPGIMQNHSSDSPVELIDLAATILELAEVQVPDDWDARSLNGILAGNTLTHREFAVSQLNDWRCITDNEWKLVENIQGETVLFHLAEDPREQHNVSGDFPEKVSELTPILEKENPWFGA